MKNLTLSVNNREWHRVNVLELSGQVRNQPDITRILYSQLAVTALVRGDEITK